MKTIVVGFDESERSERALRRAAELASALGARLLVTSVAVAPVPAPGVGAVIPGTSAQLAAEAGELLELADEHLARARALLEEWDVEAELVSDAGAPADRIVDLAERRDADLIVVGARDAGFLDRLLGRSVSDDVAHHTQRDVLIVH